MAGELKGAARAFLGQGLGMGWGDEAEAWLRSRLGGGSYESELENIRNEYARYSAQHPAVSTSLEFAGGVAPGVAAMMVPGGQAAGVAQLARAGAPAVGRLTAGALGKMAALGSTTGMVSGAGSAQEGERLSGASTGGMLGTVLGAAAPVAARGLGALGAWARERMFPTDRLITDRAAGKLNTALSEVGQSPRDIPLSLTVDRAMGVPSVVANVSPGLVDLAETVAQRTGAGARKIEETLNRQKMGSRERTHSQVVRGINPGNYYEDEQRLVQDLRAKASGLYDAAYEHGEITDPRIMAALDTPAFKSAFQRAKQISETEMAAAKLRGEDPSKYALRDVYYPKEIKPGVFELQLKSYPDVRTLDYLKRGIDANIDAGFRGQGMSTAEATALRDMRRGFVDIIDEQVPEYKKARANYGGDMEVIDAMRAGMNDFNKLDHEQVIKLVAGMSEAEKDAFRTGVARDLYSKIMNPSGNFNAAQRIIGSPEMQAKLQPLFDDPGQFRLFKAALEREAQLFNQANRVLGGSQTGKRMQMREQFEDMPGAGEAVAGAITGGFSASLLGLASRAVRKTQIPEKTASRLADMLMSRDPHEVAAVVKLLEEQAASAAPRALRATRGTAGAVTGTEAAFWPAPEDTSRPAADVEADLRGETPGATDELTGPDIEADIAAEQTKSGGR